MKVILVDTFDFLALPNPGAASHAAAQAIGRRLTGRLVTADALTGDHHFQQAGYRALLRNP